MKRMKIWIVLLGMSGSVGIQAITDSLVTEDGVLEWVYPADKELFGEMTYHSPGAGNPLLPGYFADPTVKKFGDTYYMYATTDGSGAGFGPAQVWSSKDFVNWTLLPMNWPDSHWIWAPDVMRGADGKYYFIYSQPCQLHCGVSDTPRGPWTNLLGESEAVLVGDRFVENAITLDGQTFVDDDGSVYLYWGTWGIYKGFGCGAGKMTPDKKGFTETRLIPNTEVTDFFEAPFVMKRNGMYYFMYSSGSCHDSTYRVQYATADRPLGPYTYRGCILESSADGSVDGPGHHSVLQEGDAYYIVYHRHNNPHSTRGFHRQLCADKLVFEPDGSIRKVIPTHTGIGALAASSIRSRDLAYGKPVEASSYYDENFRPEYAVDQNNGTLWRPRTMGQEWIQIDLEKIETIRTVLTQFEYGTAYYQYLIETSVDGTHWTLFADKRQNRLAGSPMADFGEVQARYVRLTIVGGQKNGFCGAVWNLKVFEAVEEASPQQWMGLTGADWDGRCWRNNQGMLGGRFILEKGSAHMQRVDQREALVLAPGSVLTYRHPLLSPQKEHTFSMWAYKDGQWQSDETEATIKEGGISIQSGKEPLVLTNLRYYNWSQEAAERSYDAQTDLVRVTPAETVKTGLVVNLTADDFAVEDTVGYIPNRGVPGGFEAWGEPALLCEIDGRKAFRFEGRQTFRSDFVLPATLRDNAPYTLEAWVWNPSLQENECVADFTTSHDELEKLMLGNGTEPRCGLINHYGWFEDVGYKEAAALAEKWQHIYVCFDGRMERVYVNGRLISEKDIQLLIKPSQYVTLGCNAEREWPFTGYLHSLKLWDECKLPEKPGTK